MPQNARTGLVDCRTGDAHILAFASNFVYAIAKTVANLAPNPSRIWVINILNKSVHGISLDSVVPQVTSSVICQNIPHTLQILGARGMQDNRVATAICSP